MGLSEQMIEATKTSLSQSLLGNLNLDFGSPLFNTLFSTLILMVFNTYFFKVFDFLNDWRDKITGWLKSFFDFNKWNIITLEGTITSNKYGNSRNYFSDRFITINDWVITNLAQIKDVKKLKEEDLRKLSLEFNSFDDHEKMLILDEFDFRLIDKENDIWVKYSVNEKESENQEKKSTSAKSISIELRSKKMPVNQLKTFVEEKTKVFMTTLEEKNMDKTYYFEYLSKNSDEGGLEFSEVKFETNRRISNVFFPQKNEFLNKFGFFMNRRDWYDRLGIPYHMGILLYGLPGCGKTSLIKAIANETGYQVISIPLSRVKTAKDLTTIFHAERINRRKVPVSKRIYLFEDIDAMQVALKREKNDEDTSYLDAASSVASGEKEGEVDKKDKKDDGNDLLAKLIKSESCKMMSCASKDDDPLTLSHLLNLIDGLIEMPGRIIIFTTNHKSKLDPALIRPGRIDIAIEMKRATREIIAEMFEWFFEKKMCEKDIAEMPNEHFTPAEISNIFYRFNTRGDDAISYLKTF